MSANHPINAKLFIMALRGVVGLEQAWDIVPQKLPDSEPNNYTWFEVKRESDGLCLHVTSDGKDRVKISVNFINGNDEMGRYSFPYGSSQGVPELTKSITLSSTKPMEQIAKDVVRRLLPDATKFQEIGNNLLREHQTYVANHLHNRNNVLALSADFFPVKPYGQSIEELNIYPNYLDDERKHLYRKPVGDVKVRIQSGYQLTFDVPHHIGIKLLEAYKQMAQSVIKPAPPARLSAEQLNVRRLREEGVKS